ncbi:hypothetical protein QN382_23475 [Pseudomonas sp. 10B1]|uniref:hypothetical protein n=1 Tax=unclassified Pseudomonas TaxID=196821 RepID=UPI002B223F1F|nr:MULTISPECIES: hypothetical protein [unclassified Pseudomonas]MEA9994315.1 hypothetical protein [Pseudomonas sp. AA4]MEB0088508.1 hypothetical protein [Pseudomonas sp. RTI1]MEB0126569.1 hypothetical protein [Pseudomonas sp. CCC1.2]MEB0154618.1 hypothetical protein [Pseudomonas sp. CCC4.3]MEB0220779.1 hypothetical protein [Pseudomonas sp. AB12(2023)]
MTDVIIQSGASDTSALASLVDASTVQPLPADTMDQGKTAGAVTLLTGNVMAGMAYSGDPLESAIHSVAHLISDLPALADRLTDHLEKLLAGQLAQLGVA